MELLSTWKIHAPIVPVHVPTVPELVSNVPLHLPTVQVNAPAVPVHVHVLLSPTLQKRYITLYYKLLFISSTGPTFNELSKLYVTRTNCLRQNGCSTPNKTFHFSEVYVIRGRI